MKKFLALVLALVMTMSLVTMAGAEDFTDAADVDYAEAVEVLTEVGIVSGYTDGSVRPDVALNRGQAAKIICNLILGPTEAAALPTGVSPYADVPAGSTFAGYIAYLSKEGVVSGYADGTFQPTAPLTGYAFMKMLLGVLGYDASIEGYTGSNWAVSVAKQALAIKLNKGLDGTFNGSKVVTRQEAMLYAFNALNAKWVTYTDKGANITIGGVTINTGASEVKTNDDNQVYFAKLFGTDLVKAPSTDTYGRPATKWTYKKEVVGTYAVDADKVYTADTKLYTVKGDIDMNTTDGNLFYWTVNAAHDKVEGLSSANRVEVGFYTSSDTTKKLSTLETIGTYAGNGVVFEIFYDMDASINNKIVVIDEYIDQVEDVDTDDDGRYIELDGGKKFYTKDFEEDQWVLFTKGWDSTNNEQKVASVKAATKLSGTVTKTESDGTYFIDGVAYDMHGGSDKFVPSIEVGTGVDFWLDSYGYVIKMEITSLSAAMENLVMLYGEEKENGFDKIQRAVFGTGKVETLTLKDSANYYTVYNYTTSSNKAVMKESAGYYSLTLGAQAGAYTKGDTKIDGATDVNVNNNTTFVFLDRTNNTTKVFTGYKNAPNFSGADWMVAYKKNNTNAALLVFVIDATTTNTSSAKTYVVADSELRIYEQNAAKETFDYYTVQTIDGGTLKVSGALMDEIVTYANAGVALLDTITLDKNGIASGSVYDGTDVTYQKSLDTTAPTTDYVDYEDGVLYVSVSDTVSSYTIDDDAVVYFVAKDGETWTKGDVNDIIDTAGKYAGYTAFEAEDDNVITTLVLKKA